MSDQWSNPEAQANGYTNPAGGYAAPAYDPQAAPPAGGYAAPAYDPQAAAPMGGYGGQPAPYYSGPAGGYGGYPVAQTNNAMAIVSLCLSIASFIFLPLVGAIAGVICGSVARKQIREPGRADTLGAGMATAGIIIGWINIGISIVITIFYIILLVGLFAAAESSLTV